MQPSTLIATSAPAYSPQLSALSTGGQPNTVPYGVYMEPYTVSPTTPPPIVLTDLIERFGGLSLLATANGKRNASGNGKQTTTMSEFCLLCLSAGHAVKECPLNRPVAEGITPYQVRPSATSNLACARKIASRRYGTKRFWKPAANGIPIGFFRAKPNVFKSFLG